MLSRDQRVESAVAGDAFSSVAFAVFGLQRTDLWFTWLVFYTDDPSYAQSQIDRIGGEYVVVDLRDARYLPRYNYYFNYAEFFDPQLAASLGKVMPLEYLTKFDAMPRRNPCQPYHSSPRLSTTGRMTS